MGYDTATIKNPGNLLRLKTKATFGEFFPQEAYFLPKIRTIKIYLYLWQ